MSNVTPEFDSGNHFAAERLMFDRHRYGSGHNDNSALGRL